MDSDALDATLSGTERLTSTVANGVALLARREAIEIQPSALIPVATREPEPVNSLIEQQWNLERLAAANANR